MVKAKVKRIKAGKIRVPDDGELHAGFFAPELGNIDMDDDDGNMSGIKRYQTSAELACRMLEGDYFDKYGISSRWLCRWLHCVHGMGIAGMGRCPGNPFVGCCTEYEDNAEWCEV